MNKKIFFYSLLYITLFKYFTVFSQPQPTLYTPSTTPAVAETPIKKVQYDKTTNKVYGLSNNALSIINLTTNTASYIIFPYYLNDGAPNKYPILKELNRPQLTNFLYIPTLKKIIIVPTRPANIYATPIMWVINENTDGSYTFEKTIETPTAYPLSGGEISQIISSGDADIYLLITQRGRAGGDPRFTSYSTVAKVNILTNQFEDIYTRNIVGYREYVMEDSLDSLNDNNLTFVSGLQQYFIDPQRNPNFEVWTNISKEGDNIFVSSTGYGGYGSILWLDLTGTFHKEEPYKSYWEPSGLPCSSTDFYYVGSTPPTEVYKATGTITLPPYKKYNNLDILVQASYYEGLPARTVSASDLCPNGILDRSYANVYLWNYETGVGIWNTSLNVIFPGATPDISEPYTAPAKTYTTVENGFNALLQVEQYPIPLGKGYKKYSRTSFPQLIAQVENAQFKNGKIYFTGVYGATQEEYNTKNWDYKGFYKIDGGVTDIKQQNNIQGKVMDFAFGYDDQMYLLNEETPNTFGKLLYFKETQGITKSITLPAHGVKNLSADGGIIAISSNDGVVVVKEESKIIDSFEVTPTEIWPYRDGVEGSGSEAKATYSLLKNAYVSIKIYDENNKLVDTLFENQIKNQGVHSEEENIWLGTVNTGDQDIPEIIANKGNFKFIISAIDANNPQIKDEKFVWIEVKSMQ